MQLVSINDVAAMISVSPRTIRQYIADGLLPRYKLPGATIKIKRVDGSTHKIDRGNVRLELGEVELALARFRHGAIGELKRRAGRVAQPIDTAKEIIS